MSTRSSLLYLNRKKHILRNLDDLPLFPPNRLRYHIRPHELLPELRTMEDPSSRLAVVDLNEVLGYIDRELQTE